MQNQIHIQGVNGIADLRIDLRDPGVHVARGPNGAGKSSAISAVRSALGDTTATVEPTDGTPAGTVTGCGVTLKVGRQRRATGEATVELADTGALARLIDPGFKDSAVAARERIRALLEMVPLPATDEVLARLAGGDSDLAESVPLVGDVLVLAEGVRLRAMELARTHEAKQAEAEGAAKYLRDQLPAMPLSSPKTLEQAQRDLDGATRASERIRAQRDAREALEEKQAAARHLMGERPDLGAVQRRVSVALEALEAAKAALASAKTEHAAALEAEAGAQRAEAQWQRYQDLLSQSVEGATTADVEAADLIAAEAVKMVDAARAAQQDAADRADLEKRIATAKEAAELATRYRAVVLDLPKVLADELARAGLEGLTVVNGRLAMVEGGRPLDFETRLSFGQRVRCALRAALLAHKGKGPAILALDPTFWAALDPARKVDVDAAAKELGVVILTEEPTDGALRVEVLK